MTELLKIELPEYILRVKISEKRRTKYYTTKSKIPKKYSKYKFDRKGILVDPLGNKIISNPRAQGTPSWTKISGQAFYSGFGHSSLRAKIVKEMKIYFIKALKEFKPIDINQFPIQIHWDLYQTIGAANWDLDNLWIYNKCFQDALVEAGIIPEDNITYITKSAAPEFYPVESEDDRKMVFKITKEEREEILKHPHYEVHRENKEW
jgi:hypothetical protein